MADGTVGEGAVTVHPGAAAVVAGTGGEVPVRHAERGRDPAEDTHCKRKIAKHAASAAADEENRAFESNGGRRSKGISGCSNMLGINWMLVCSSGSDQRSHSHLADGR